MSWILERAFPRRKEEIEQVYAGILAPFAVQGMRERSRDYAEAIRDEENRSDFQRDRDRIIHSKAFRRLMYKTQVFVNHEGDHFRTRLTHTLEVAQLARGICRSLALNEDLAEAIALGHDLGHTPFGHAVERYLCAVLQREGCGSFYHNEQSVRVVDFIERRGNTYQGLNLTAEVREGILKHNGDRSGIYQDLQPEQPCGFLEGQIVALVDTAAYICHDLQDGIQSGLVEKAISSNRDFAVGVKEMREIIEELVPGQKIEMSPYDDTFFIDNLLHKFVMSMTQQTAENLTTYQVETLRDIRRLAGEQVVLAAMKPEDQVLFHRLKKLVYHNVYALNTIQIMDRKAKQVAQDLFESFMEQPTLLPPEELDKINHIEQEKGYSGYQSCPQRIICDYISCMTDRFALEEHERLRNPRIKI